MSFQVPAVHSQGKKNDFAQRRDVVNKTILRNMRRFFMRGFNSVHNFQGKKKHRKAEEYMACIRDYAKTVLKGADIQVAGGKRKDENKFTEEIT